MEAHVLDTVEMAGGMDRLDILYGGPRCGYEFDLAADLFHDRLDPSFIGRRVRGVDPVEVLVEYDLHGHLPCNTSYRKLARHCKQTLPGSFNFHHCLAEGYIVIIMVTRPPVKQTA